MNIFFPLFLIILSSFTKCFIDSKLDKNFLYRRSCCNSCKNILKFLDLIPIFSYIFLKGKCRKCNDKIPTDIFLYELGGLFVAVLYFFSYHNSYFVGYINYLIILILTFIAIEDIKKYEINVRLQIILLSLSILNFILNFNFDNLLYSIILILIYNLIYILINKNIGYGDIKLFSILALNISFINGIYLFLYTFIFAGFFAIYLLIFKKAKKNTKVALAPYILLSYITILFIKIF